jgi:hypothetical protein
MRFLQTLIARSTACAPITGVVETSTSTSCVERQVFERHVFELQRVQLAINRRRHRMS